MITDEQRHERRKFLGSSDAPCIVGVNKWKNAADVYYDKINPPTDNDPLSDNDAIIVGNMCESAVLDWFCKETGKTITRDQRRVHTNGIMACNYDALVDDEDEAVEAKTTGIIFPFNKDEWGEVGTDELPERIIVQCQHQMSVLPNITIVHVPVLMGGVGFRMYHVERNDELIQNLEQLEVDFWNNHVLAENPPDDIPTMETLKKIARVPNKFAIIDNELVANWISAKERASIANKQKEEAQRAVIAALGDAEGAETSYGLLTYYETYRKGYEVKPGTYRTPRLKKI